MVKALLILICIVSLISGVVERASAQAAPGFFADANHPAGSPDPEKLDGVWSIDPISDQVSMNIPFFTTPQGGRGPKLPFALLYNSASTVTLQGNGTFYGESGPPVTQFAWSAKPIAGDGGLVGPSGPWTTTGPYFYSAFAQIPDVTEPNGNGGTYVSNYGCVIYGPYTYVDPEGSPHDTNLLNVIYTSTPTGAVPGASECVDAQSGPTTYWPSSVTSDGSTMATSSGSAIGQDGTAATGVGGLQAGSPGTLTDPNGNSASISTANGVTTATDALGRTVYKTNIPIGQIGQIPAGSYYVTTYGPTGNAENYNVVFSTIAVGSFTMPHPNPSNNEISSSSFCPQCYTNYQVLGPSATFTAVTELELPDTSAYSFTYDQTYGTISKITFPTGGYVRFAWGIRDKDWNWYGQFNAISSVVVTDAYLSSGSSENHWSYTMESLSSSSTPIGKVIAPDSSWTTYTGACFSYILPPFYSFLTRASCKETSHANYSSTGTLLASQAETFRSDGLPIQVVMGVYDGPSPLQRQTVNNYDNYDNIIEKDESDFVSCNESGQGLPCPIPSQTTGPWLRKTFTTFTATCNSTLAAKHIVNKPCQVVVTNGSGTPYSLVSYGYDSNGNLLNESKCLSISGTGSAATCSSSWQTQYSYTPPTGSVNGQVYSKTEGYGTSAAATTTYTWSGQANGYLYAVTYPNGATESYTYYETTTGQVHTHKDWNKNQTTYDYTDPLHRIHTFTAPATVDGTTGSSGQGVTSYSYTDTSGAFSVQEQHTVNTLPTTTSTTTYFDGLGRKITTKTVTPQCSTPIEVDTVYDSMSRVYTVSNPYCSTSDSTYGLTTFTYDALSRKIQTTNPDNTSSTVTYGGNATEITDPTNGTVNPQHIQQVNGLNQLTGVCEVSASTFGGVSPASCGMNVTGSGYSTSYAYDPLGNLLAVNQHGVSRSFTYDSLGRLTYAMNPEAGSVSYGYLTSSNAPCSPNSAAPCSKTDARGVTVTYGYDNLGRLLSKAYSDHTTPISCYQFDAGTGTNPTGYLTNAWTQAASSGSCNSSPTSFINLKSFLNYDAVGRLLNAQQQTCIGGKCSGPTPYQVSMTYDLAGNATTITNSVGANNQPLTLTNYFDSASRPCLTTSSWTANASPNLFQINPAVNPVSPGYSPAGGLQNYFMGSSSSPALTSCSSSPTSPINAILNYTKRFWVSSISTTGQIP